MGERQYGSGASDATMSPLKQHAINAEIIEGHHWAGKTHSGLPLTATTPAHSLVQQRCIERNHSYLVGHLTMNPPWQRTVHGRHLDRHDRQRPP